MTHKVEHGFKGLMSKYLRIHASKAIRGTNCLTANMNQLFAQPAFGDAGNTEQIHMQMDQRPEFSVFPLCLPWLGMGKTRFRT